MGLLSVMLRLALIAMSLIYVLPHLLDPTPRALLDARQFITVHADSAIGALLPSDIARQIEAMINLVSR